MQTLPYVDISGSLLSSEKRTKQSPVVSTSPPMSLTINITTRIPLARPSTTPDPAPHLIDSPHHPSPEAPGTLHEYMTSQVYLHDEATTPPGSENFTDESSFITSLVTSFVPNETIASISSGVEEHENAILPNHGLSHANLVLITSLSIVIGCFAITALLLRIGSRVRKARKLAEERRRRRRIAVRRNQGGPSPHIKLKPIRVLMETDKRGKRTKKTKTKTKPPPPFVIRAQPNRTFAPHKRVQELKEDPVPPVRVVPSKPRTKPEEVAVEMSALPADVALEEGLGSQSKSESFTSETDLLESSNKNRKRSRENEYDNPVMNVTDPEGERKPGTSSDSDTPFTSETSNIPSWGDSPSHHVSGESRRASSPGKISLPSNLGDRSDGVRESSESEGAMDVHRRVKLLRMHGRKNSGNNSRDSGYAGGSFISQDSSRNLLAFRDDPYQRDAIGANMSRDGDMRDVASVIPETENESAPLVKLRKTDSLYNPQMLRQHPNKHRNVSRNYSDPYFIYHRRPPHRLFNSFADRTQGYPRYNEHPYIADCPPLYYEEPSSTYSGHPGQSHYQPLPNRGNIYHIPTYPAQQYFPNIFAPSPTYPRPQTLFDDRTRYVKRKSTSTQTPTDPDSLPIPQESPPPSPSIITWSKEGRFYVIVPKGGLDLDYLGPVYLAESLSGSDQTLSNSTETLNSRSYQHEPEVSDDDTAVSDLERTSETKTDSSSWKEDDRLMDDHSDGELGEEEGDPQSASWCHDTPL